MRVIVVGGGVIGLLTAVECVRAGHHVTVVERGELPNPLSASADRHRIIRALHLGDAAATGAATRAHAQWAALERLLYSRFYSRVGALSVLPPEQVAGAVSVLGQAGVWSRVLSAAELADRYRPLRFGPDVVAVLERDAGVLLADRVLRACVGWLRWRDTASLLAHADVVAIDPATASVRLVDGSVLAADAVVVAAGAWSARLLPAVAGRVTLWRQSVLYCRTDDEDTWSTLPAMPRLHTPDGCWLVPPVAGTPLKLSAHSAGRVVDAVTDHGCDPAWQRHLLETFAPVIPTLRADWVRASRDCYYLSDTVSGGPLLAVLGTTVLAYAACGGSSFKFAPLIARALAQRVAGIAEPVGIAAVDEPHHANPAVPIGLPEGDRV